MRFQQKCVSLAAGVLLASTLSAPAVAFAETADAPAQMLSRDVTARIADTLSQSARQLANAREEALARANAMLPVDEALIAAVGTQEGTGHSICCPAFACAYGDAIVRGTAASHTAYGCGCCTWPGWGGGNSSFRNLGSADALLAEAYASIQAGFPTVIHVAAGWGEHWITLVGYQNVCDPTALALENFVALDPWDGALITASDRYTLYGDNCEHISEAWRE